MEIEWVAGKTPDDLGEAIEEYGDRVLVAIFAVAQYFAQDCQDEMRVMAPWDDQTGNARSGLFSAVERAAADIVDIYLSHGHTIEYGKYLELAHGGTYAVIMPTIEANLPVLEKMLDEIFRD
jgi:hypothetical protein